MLRNCQHFTAAIMAPVEILVKLMSAFMYRRPVGLVSLLTVQPGRVAAAKTGALTRLLDYASTSQRTGITPTTGFLQSSCRQRIGERKCLGSF